ncbi:porin family protein [Costertonia aggregata]|uniref:PorT family protein n=1 Tax=Costertonia aggregata TaxID=343403 RepID=A0A7H9APH4_9FLAO|nr:porin family protein [Costertonia aggregata]QLG45358.1 PorT family protein [Costertonia aggregata]
MGKILKKALLLTLIWAFATQYCNAQNEKFGIMGGINYSRISGESPLIDVATTGRIAYNIGVYSEFAFYNGISFSPRIIFSSQGYVQELFQSENETMEIVNKFNFVNVPAIFKFRIYDELNLQIGPQVGLWLNGNAEVIKSDSGEFLGDKTKLTADSKFDFGGNLGISYKLADRFIMEVTYFHGFSDFVGFDFPVSKSKNSVFQFNIAYLIF